MNEGIPDFFRVANRTKPLVPEVKSLVWAYTMLQTYDNICPHQAYRRFIKKDIPFFETPAMTRGNEVHAALEYRVGGGKPLPVQMQQYEVIAAPLANRGAKAEQWVGINRDGTFADSRQANYGRGKIDVNIVCDRSAYLVDYKTGKVREEPFELEVQAVFLKAQHPQLKTIVAQYAWLAEVKMGKVYDVSDTQATWARINHIVAKIGADRARGTFDKRQTGLCGWCPVKDCEHNKNREN